MENTVDFKNAGFWLRLVAFIIDAVIVFFTGSFIWTILQFPVFPDKTITLFFSSFFLYKNPLNIFLVWLFCAFFESSKFQATPGKSILGLKVTNMAHQQIGFGQATGRYFGKLISSFIFIIGYFMIGFTKNKQGLHDKMAKTLVIKVSAEDRNKKQVFFIPFVVSLFLFMISLTIPANTKAFDQLDSLTEDYLSEMRPTVPFSYKDISFDYPDNWHVEIQEIRQDLAYQINCSEIDTNSSNFIYITWLDMDKNPLEWIQGMVDNLKDMNSYKLSINTTPIVSTNYCGYDGYKMDYTMETANKKANCQIICFNKTGKTYTIVKQSSTTNGLDSKFRVIENSLVLKEDPLESFLWNL